MANQRFEDRLHKLQAEYDAGQKMLAELDAKRQNLLSTLLRIDGAMQVLREMLEQDATPPGGDPGPPAA